MAISTFNTASISYEEVRREQERRWAELESQKARAEMAAGLMSGRPIESDLRGKAVEPRPAPTLAPHNHANKVLLLCN